MSSEPLPAKIAHQGRMSEEELAAYLKRPVLCRLAGVKPDGNPFVIPLWHAHADGGFYFVVRERADWVPHVLAEPRVALCIDSEEYERVFVDGTVEVVERPNAGGRWVAICEEMSRRYFGEDGLAYFQKSLHEPRWLLFVRPTRVQTWVGGWAKRYKHSAW